MLAALLLTSVCGPSAILGYSIGQWRREPEMRIEDAYKWLYHANLGGDHAVQDETGPRMWMDREWPSLRPATRAEPEFVNLRPDGKVIRVNLRPYKFGGGNKDMMLAVFVASAREFKGDKREFVRDWRELGEYLKRDRIGAITLTSWRKLDSETKTRGYPAIHHSAEYERVVKPAYRVVLRDLWAG